jgi:protein-disulfide isomerase
MKHTPTLAAFLVGALIGGGGVAATSTGGGVDRAEVEGIIKEYLMNHGDVVMQGVQKWQDDQRDAKMSDAREALKDLEVQKALYANPKSPFIGKEDSKAVVVEFFDYNCPACKMAFQAINELHSKDKDVKVIFKEFPIFGPVSEMNSKIGLAVATLAPAKYFEFHSKMMTFEGRTDEAQTMKFATEAGLKEADIREEIKKPEYQAYLDSMRELGNKLGIQGTPSLVIGEELVPHALDYQGLEAKVAPLR